MKYIIYVIIIGAIIGVTFGLFTSWGWNGLVPDLILLIVIALSLVFDGYDFLFFGMLGGFWLDIVYGLPIGSFTIPLLFCGAISSLLIRKWLFSEVKWYHFIGSIIAATVLLKFWIWLYGNMLFALDWYPVPISGGQIVRNLIWAIIANVILAYPVYVIVEMFARSQLRWQKNRIRL